MRKDKKRDNYLCQVFLKDNIYTYNNLQIYLIFSIKEDKSDSDNLITLFFYHHK